MAQRTRKQVQGKQIYLAVQKPEATSFITGGCAEDISYKSDKETIKYSCRSGTGKLPSGEDPDWSVSIKGFYFIYADGEKDANVSFIDFHNWHLNDVVVPIRFGTDYDGDPVFEGKVIIKSITLEAPNSGLATYSIECEGYERITVTENN